MITLVSGSLEMLYVYSLTGFYPTINQIFPVDANSITYGGIEGVLTTGIHV